jgi:hypothetical protein
MPVAKELGLPAWWLNEQASVYISGNSSPDGGTLSGRSTGGNCAAHGLLRSRCRHPVSFCLRWPT